MVVHLCGRIADMKSIKKYQINIICLSLEDPAAQAIGSKYDGKKVDRLENLDVFLHTL